MYCENCGNKIAKDSKFCSSCGTGIRRTKVETTQVTSEAMVAQTEKPNVLNSILSIVFFIAAFALGRFLGLVVFIFILAWGVGEWFPKWYMDRKKINPSLVKGIVWSNVITWLLPPLGVLTGFAALKFGDYFPGEGKKYKTIAITALVASFFNAIVGILIKL